MQQTARRGKRDENEGTQDTLTGDTADLRAGGIACKDNECQQNKSVIGFDTG